MTAILTVKELSVRLRDPADPARWTVPVDRVSLTLHRGRTTVVVGETGAGKSLLFTSLIGLLPPGAEVAGSARLMLDPSPVELTRLSGQAWRRIRGRRIGLLSQQAAFSPVRTIGAQLSEVHPIVHLTALAEDCGLSPALLQRHPSELSGGQLRRAALVAALLHDPVVLLADEPTAGIGAAEVGPVLERLRAPRRARVTEAQGTEARGTLVVTHDLAVAEGIADDLVVMRRGRIVEAGPAERVLTAPEHPYTRRLLAARREVTP